jgi:hypothetical protein
MSDGMDKEKLIAVAVRAGLFAAAAWIDRIARGCT